MPRIPRNRKVRRLTLDLSEQVRAELDELRELTQAGSLVEVIRRALAVCSFLWAKADDGTLTYIDDDGQEQTMELIPNKEDTNEPT